MTSLSTFSQPPSPAGPAPIGKPPHRRRPGAAAWLAAALALAPTVACVHDSSATGAEARPDRALTPALTPGAAAVLPTAASVPPLAYLLQQIGGDRVEVVSAVPSAAVAESYHPTIQQIARLSRARLVLRIGHRQDRNRPPIEVRLDPVWEQKKDLVTVTMPVDTSQHEPHPWLSPASMLETATALAAALEQIDADGARQYRQALSDFRNQVTDLDRDLRALLQDRNVTVLVVHPAWTALAEDYGFRQVALEVEGKEPSARRLVELIDLARVVDAHTIFVQRGFSTASARAIANEIGAEIVEVDPLAYDWPTTLLATAHQFAREGSAASHRGGS